MGASGERGHELNNPLSIVVMEADMLSEEVEDGPLLAHARKITRLPAVRAFVATT
jgi:hypothetical protein